MTVSGYINVTAGSVCLKREANSFLLYIGHVGHILQLQKRAVLTGRTFQYKLFDIKIKAGKTFCYIF